MKTWTAILLFSTLLISQGCSISYHPVLLARGEMTIKPLPLGGFALRAENRLIAHQWTLYSGLRRYVRCVPSAQIHAKKAYAFGWLWMLSMISAVGSGIGGCAYQITDGGGVPWQTATLGFFSAGSSVLGTYARIQSAGHAVDAMNYYNDAVGSLGATCDDPTYPPPTLVIPTDE